MALTSQNGWPASPDPAAIGVDQHFTVRGITFPGGVKSGAVATVFRDLVLRYMDTVEPLNQGWCWGYEFRVIRGGSGDLSNHSSASALDLNSPLHPQGTAGTMSKDAARGARSLVERYEGCIAWGGDWVGSVDEMHWEVSADQARIEQLAADIERVSSPPAAAEGIAMPLSDQDVARVAAAVLEILETERVVPMLRIDPKTGSESREQVSITRALQSAQTQASRAAYRGLEK